MKIVKKIWLWLLPVILAFAALLYFIPKSVTDVYAALPIAIVKYDSVYDIHADRTMHVEEIVTVQYMSSSNTGIARDIPVNDGDRVRNVDVKVIENGQKKSYPYDVKLLTYDEVDLAHIFDAHCITVEITDGRYKSYESTQTFFISYDYEITKPKNANMLPLNPIGFGIEAPVYDASVTLKLPKGFNNEKTVYMTYKGDEGSPYDYDAATRTITAHVDERDSYTGVTFNLAFDEGVLSTKFDITPYILIIIGCLILGALIVVKLLVFNKDRITPITTISPPFGLDPLALGKLIDNTVNNSDVTSLLYYWADKGYIKIDFADEKNISFIRILQTLPEDAPSYQHTMYNELFKSGDLVTLNSLENTFYTTVTRVKNGVNATYRGLYTKTSSLISIVFAILGALIACVTPILLAMFRVSFKLFYPMPFLMLIPFFIVYAGMRAISDNSLKNKRKTRILLYLVVALVCLAVTTVYTLLIPDAFIETLPKILVCIISFATVILSVTIVSRTPSYVEQLNQIMGFRDFITTVEKDQLEEMLEENPQLYYHILPYAQVLGVSDKWTDKFKALTIEPPRWSSTPLQTYVEISVISNLLRRTNTTMAMKMVSRPSSNGMSGGFHGGGGGGFGGGFGGGHGGGGIRGI